MLAQEKGRQVATRFVFFVCGFAVASWAALIPYAKAQIRLDDAQLGRLLLCIGVGSVGSMLFSGALAAKYGCRAVLLCAGAIVCATLPFLAIANTAIALAICLLCFGAGIGTMDVVMNIQAVIVEKAAGRAMMSGFHGLFSVGGIAGAGAMAALLSIGLSPLASILTVAAISAGFMIASAKGLLPFGGNKGAPAFAIPTGPVILIGSLCLVMFLAEGSVMDWSGVLLSTVRGVGKGQAGLGYLAFSITMTAGRLFGDPIVGRFGPKAILFAGGICSATGFAIGAIAPWWPISILGFALFGVGAANIVPVLFTAAGRQTSLPSNLAIAAVTTMGYAGMLVGPAAIGFAARSFTLPIALCLVAAMVSTVALSSRRAAT